MNDCVLVYKLYCAIIVILSLIEVSCPSFSIVAFPLLLKPSGNTKPKEVSDHYM